MVNERKLPTPESRKKGPLFQLLTGFVVGGVCYWLGWLVLSGVSSPSSLSTRLYPVIPAGLVFLHFYIRWYAAECSKETEVSHKD